ncbi:MAG: hypothetical protein RR659_05280, partial [Bacilli bacterium]
MKLAVLILKDDNKLDELLTVLSKENYRRVTVLNSNSYETEKGKKNSKQTNIFASIRYMVDFYNDESKTIFIPTTKDRIENLKEIIKGFIKKEEYTFFSIDIS